MFNAGPTSGFMSRFGNSNRQPRQVGSQPFTHGQGLLSAITGGRMMMPNRRPNQNQMLPGLTGSITGDMSSGDNPIAPKFGTMPVPNSNPTSPAGQPQPPTFQNPTSRFQNPFTFSQMPQPTQQPTQDSQLWQTYNKLNNPGYAMQMIS